MTNFKIDPYTCNLRMSLNDARVVLQDVVHWRSLCDADSFDELINPDDAYCNHDFYDFVSGEIVANGHLLDKQTRREDAREQQRLGAYVTALHVVNRALPVTLRHAAACRGLDYLELEMARFEPTDMMGFIFDALDPATYPSDFTPPPWWEPEFEDDESLPEAENEIVCVVPPPRPEPNDDDPMPCDVLCVVPGLGLGVVVGVDVGASDTGNDMWVVKLSDGGGYTLAECTGCILIDDEMPSGTVIYLDGTVVLPSESN